MEFLKQVDPSEFYLWLGGALLLYYLLYFGWFRKRRTKSEKVKIFGNSKNISTFEQPTSIPSEIGPSEGTTEAEVDGRAASPNLDPLQDLGAYSPSTFDYKQHLPKEDPLSSEAENLNNTDDGQKVISLRPSREDGPQETS